MTKQVYPLPIYELIAYFRDNADRFGHTSLKKIPQHLNEWMSYCEKEKLVGNNCGKCCVLGLGKFVLQQHEQDAGQQGNRRGRTKKGESDKDTLVIAALVAHHKYESGGIIGNYNPVKGKELMRATPGLTDAAISRFFKEQFPGLGHKGYDAVCNKNTIGMHLAKWQNESPQSYGQSNK